MLSFCVRPKIKWFLFNVLSPQLPKLKTFGEGLKKFRNSSTKERKGENLLRSFLPSYDRKWSHRDGGLSPLCRIVVMAGDTLPIEVYCHLPVMCEDRNLPYAYIPSKVVSLLSGPHQLAEISVWMEWRCVVDVPCLVDLFLALLLGSGVVGGVEEADLCDPDQTSRGLSRFLQRVSGGSVQPSQTSLKHNPVEEVLTGGQAPLFCVSMYIPDQQHVDQAVMEPTTCSTASSDCGFLSVTLCKYVLFFTLFWNIDLFRLISLIFR